MNKNNQLQSFHQTVFGINYRGKDKILRENVWKEKNISLGIPNRWK